MTFQVCPFHSDDAVRGTPLPDEAGGEEFICRRGGHPGDREWRWTGTPPPPDAVGGGLAAELGLDLELPAAVASYGGRWVEYGLVERAYADAHGADFAGMVARWGHTHLGRTDYTVSKYLGGQLGRLARQGALLYRAGPGTGRWSYNSTVGYYAPPPVEPDWDDRLSWEAAGVAVDYVG